METRTTSAGTGHSEDRDLVFDIGLNNGDDAAYYLHLGYRVLGIEANPLLAAQCTRRFEDEIREGQIKIVNAGVLKEPGEFSFYRNLQDDGWSSFDPGMGKKGGHWEELTIRCITTEQLIEEHGKPFYMKVDIEGMDIQTLYSLTPASSPEYVSLELNRIDPILERLVELGYTAFKFINGDTMGPTPLIFNHQTGWRLLRKVGRLAPLVRNGIRRLPQRLRPYSEFDPPYHSGADDYPFGASSSGPFGEDAAGSWLTAAEACDWFRDLKENYLRDGPNSAFWWDVHARHSKAPRP